MDLRRSQNPIMPQGAMPTDPMPEPSNDGTPEPKKRGGFRKFMTVLAVVVMVAGLGAAGYFYKQLSDIKKNPNKVAQDETAATLAAIGKLIVLPAGEQPTLATVTDPSKLKDQPFFANAKTGDKVLIYTNAKKAILYSPSENKIVEVAPVNIGNSTGNSTVTGASTTTPPSNALPQSDNTKTQTKSK
jgi:hypothetical protein